MMQACERHPNRSGLERWHHGVRGTSPCLLMATLCLDCWHADAARGVEGIQLADGTPWSPCDPPPPRSTFPIPAKELTVPENTPARTPTLVTVDAPPRAPSIDILAEGGEPLRAKRTQRKGRPIITCIGCGLERPLHAKDRCKACYNRLYKRTKQQAQHVAAIVDSFRYDTAGRTQPAPTPTDEHTGIDLALVRQRVTEARTAQAVREAAMAALERVIGRWPDAVPMEGRAQVELILARMASGLDR